MTQFAVLTLRSRSRCVDAFGGSNGRESVVLTQFAVLAPNSRVYCVDTVCGAGAVADFKVASLLC